MTTHYLIADDNGVCISQAHFTVLDADRVQVLALMGATRYIDRVCSREEAREEWRTLVNRGWTLQIKTPIVSSRILKDRIYN